MATLEEQRKQLETARKQAQEQREQIAKRREEAQQQKTRIAEEEKKLPVASQRRLRSGLYSGLEGRKRRQVISGMKQELGKGKQEIDVFTGELKKYEKEELTPFESQIQKADSELREQEAEKRDWDTAQRVVDAIARGKGAAIFGLRTGRQQRFYREITAGTRYYGAKQVTTPTAPNIVAIGTGGSWVDVPERQQIVWTPDSKSSPASPDFRATPTRTPTLRFTPPRDLSRTDVLKDFSQLKKLDIQSVRTDTRSVLDRPFLTTGSPKRITPLTSLQPRRPPTPSKPQYKTKSKSKPSIKKSSFISFGSRDEDDFLFGRKKKKKKKSIWGF